MAANQLVTSLGIGFFWAVFVIMACVALFTFGRCLCQGPGPSPMRGWPNGKTPAFVTPGSAFTKDPDRRIFHYFAFSVMGIAALAYFWWV
jgi:bacteriorhodopsin